MKYAAVVFDLFGTLVAVPTRQEELSALMQMASALSAPFDDFWQLWSDMSHERARGVLQSPEASIEYVCRKLGIHVEDAHIKRAAKIRFDYIKRSMIPREDTIEVLSHLKSEGYKTGLISDCPSEVPAIWKRTPFAELIDGAVFSCSAGMIKPDPRIYKLVTEQLAVRPEDCLYVGDGNNQELTGASQVGMYPVLIRVPGEDTPDALRANRDEWAGPVISSLREVLALVGACKNDYAR